MYETIPWIKVWLFNDSSKLRPNHAINHDIWQQLKVATLFTLKPFRWEHFNWIQTFLNIFCEENRWNHEFWTCGRLVQLCLDLFGTIIRLKERRGDSPWIMRVLGSIPILNLKRTFQHDWFGLRCWRTFVFCLAPRNNFESMTFGTKST